MPAGRPVDAHAMMQWLVGLRDGEVRALQPYVGATAELVAAGFVLGNLNAGHPFLAAPEGTPCWLRALAAVALAQEDNREGLVRLGRVLEDMMRDEGAVPESMELLPFTRLLHSFQVAYCLRVFYTRHGEIEWMQFAMRPGEEAVRVAFVVNLETGEGHYFVYLTPPEPGAPMPERFCPQPGREDCPEVVDRLGVLAMAAKALNPGESGPIFGPADREMEADDCVIVTRQYHHDFPTFHQCLCMGGLASANVLQEYPGPFCIDCQVGVWRGMPCPHLMKALVRGQKVLILGWEIKWALALVSLFPNVWVMRPEDSRPVSRPAGLHYAFGVHVDGREPETVGPFPQPKTCTLGVSLPLGERALARPGSRGTGATTWRWMLQPHQRASLWFRLAWRCTAGPLGAAVGANAGLRSPGWLQGLAGWVRNVAVPGLVGFARRVWEYHTWKPSGCPFRIMASNLEADLREGMKAVWESPGLIADVLAIKGGDFWKRLHPWGSAPPPSPYPDGAQLVGQVARGGALLSVLVAAYLGYRAGRWLSSRPVTLVPSFEADRPVPESCIRTGSAKVDAAVRSRAVARQLMGTDLMQPLLTSVAAREGYPELSMEGVELATHILERGPRISGSMQDVRGVCWSCRQPLPAKAKLHMCHRCYLALPGQGNRYAWDRRVQTIVELGLPVCEPVPVVPVYSEYVPPPNVEQQELWKSVKTNFNPEHAELFRQQNRIQRGVLLGVGHPGHWPGVAQRGPESMYNGLKTRTFRQVIEGEELPYVCIEAFIDDMLPKLQYGVVQPMPLEQWFHEQQRELDMRQAHRAYVEEGLTEAEMHCCPFVKSEWYYSARAVGEGQDWAVSFKPRPIYCLPDKTQVLVGPHTRPLMHFFQEVMGPGEVLQYCGCNTPAQNQAVLDELVARVQAGEVVWMNDFTCFETSHCQASMSLLLGLYRRVWAVQVEPERDRVLEAWMKSTFRVQSCGIRISGDLPLMMLSGRSDTAIMNSLFNALVTASAHVLARLGLGWEHLSALDHQRFRDELSKYRMYFVGDDSTVVGPPADAGYSGRLERLYARAGLTSKIEETSDLSKVVFLGHRPYNMRLGNARKWVWGPTLGRRMYKHHFALDVTGDPRSWLQTIVDMESKLFGPLPVLGTMARRVSELVGRPRKLNKLETRRLEEKSRYTMAVAVGTELVADATTFEDLARAYGLSPEALRDLDKLCSSIPSVPYLLSHPALDVVMRVDN